MLKVAFIVLLLLATALSDVEELVVKIKNGLVRGTYMESKSGRKFLAFMGIPYAKPPLGDLRFKLPVSVDDWKGVRDATNVHDMCIQKALSIKQNVVKGTEDCLFLNVYTPKIPNKQLFPVMMYIHGGCFNIGTGSKSALNPEILLNKDIVLVTINYRLGPMGFLSTGDSVVSGNMGLKDQTMALKWIQNNIKYMGGDPNAVTIFGNSAGGASAHLHLFSTLSKGLFHGIISQSGTATSHWSLTSTQKAIQLSNKLARIFNCSTVNSDEMIKCLQKIEAKDLIEAQDKFLLWDIEPCIIFGPIIEPRLETAFISDTPENILKNGLGSDVPMITGVTTDEGLMRSADILRQPIILKEFNEKFHNLASILLLLDNGKDSNNAIAKIKEYYFGEDDIGNINKKAFTDMLTDICFNVGASNAIDLHRKYLKQPVYFYRFAYIGSFSFVQILGGTEEDVGVCHADELFYLFPMYENIYPGKLPSANDRKISDVLVDMWTNFAKYKNPTPMIYESMNAWKPVQSIENEYFDINSYENMTMEKNMNKERVDFLKSLIPSLTPSGC